MSEEGVWPYTAGVEVEAKTFFARLIGNTLFLCRPRGFGPLTFIILILPPSHHNEIEKKKRSA